MAIRSLLVLSVAMAACGGGGHAPDPDAAVICARGPGWSAATAVAGGAVQETAAVAVGGKIYVIGGFLDGAGVTAAVRVFDTSACAWSDAPPLPRALHHANAVVANGTIYVLGALVASTFNEIGDVWSYNPASDAGWTPRASMPAGTERGAAVAGVIDGKIYIAGGLQGGGAVAVVSAYSIADDRWDTALPALPRLRDHACGGVVGGKLYVIGGRGDSDTIVSPSGLVFEYAPGAGWRERATMPTGRGGAACGVHGDRIIIAGGEGNNAAASGVFREVEIYSATDDRWEALAPMPTPRHGMAGAVSDGMFHVPGGATRAGFGAVDVHEAFGL